MANSCMHYAWLILHVWQRTCMGQLTLEALQLSLLDFCRFYKVAIAPAMRFTVVPAAHASRGPLVASTTENLLWAREARWPHLLQP
jgi:hypothetical protein